MSPRSLAPLLLVLLANPIACGSRIDDDKQSPDDRRAGLSLEGSYELWFTSATATLAPGGPPPPATPASRDHRARLDLRRAGDGYEAVFTARWGSSAPYVVTVTADALTLRGEGHVTGKESYATSSDTWETLTLVRNAGGLLTGEVRAVGRYDVVSGDVGWSGALSGAGTLSPDVTAPELRSQPQSRIGPVDRLLPWDTLMVSAAEPLARKDVLAATRVDTPAGESLKLTWLPEGKTAGTGETWAGATTFLARVEDWATAMKPSGWQFTQAAGVRDLVGNLGAKAGAELKFLSLPLVARAVDFDSDSFDAAFWGTAEILGGGLAGTDDPRCESGGCLRLGPARFDGCLSPRAGMAARLNRGTTGRVSIRYRVLMHPDLIEGDSPTLYGDLFTMELATPGAPVKTVDVPALSTTKWSKLPTPVDGMTWTTEWTTIDTLVPEGSGPFGVAIAAARGNSCTGGPGPPSANVAYLIERVEAK